jgi:hypothetical protein
MMIFPPYFKKHYKYLRKCKPVFCCYQVNFTGPCPVYMFGNIAVGLKVCFSYKGFGVKSREI